MQQQHNGQEEKSSQFHDHFHLFDDENERQMSEAFITSVFLAMSGGFQDAYTYFTRDEVFSNAQTGNVVLMSQNFMTGQWGDGLRYLFPVLAFAIGVVAAENPEYL